MSDAAPGDACYLIVPKPRLKHQERNNDHTIRPEGRIPAGTVAHPYSKPSLELASMLAALKCS